VKRNRDRKEELMSSSPRFVARAAEQSDVPALVQLLEAYMQETFQVSWQGSAEALRRDGFGREFEIQVAVTGDGRVIGFTAWAKAYDLHHCITGGYILDLYVAPEFRGRGVAPALICTVAAEILRRGGTYVKGQAINNKVVQRLYARFAVCFPGADCIVGGRAFRQVAALAGHSARVATRLLPEKSWNYEP
jgi:GNAT superfamily N-acetyltransferase